MLLLLLYKIMLVIVDIVAIVWRSYIILDILESFIRLIILKRYMNKQQKYDLITKNLQEVIGGEKLKKILSKRNLKVYMGTAPTGKPHLGYFVTIFKLADFLKAGCEVTFLFADLHAYLDNMKSSWDLLDKRIKYYELAIKNMLKLIGVSLTKLKFARGSDFQLKRKYTLDMYKISALVNTRDTQKAGADVVKQTKTPKMSGLLYPILQSLDEEYLGVDAQYGGMDQRKIFMFAGENLQKIGYKKRIHLLSYLIPGLGKEGKMSSSEPNSKIELDDDAKTIKKKINKAFCIDGVVQGNGLLAILEFIIFPKLDMDGKKFIINRPEQYGGKIVYSNYNDVEKDFSENKLSSIDLKQGIGEELVKFLKPLKKILDKNKKLEKQAYPN